MINFLVLISVLASPVDPTSKLRARMGHARCDFDFDFDFHKRLCMLR